MTARVGYFTANVTEDPGRVAGACQMLRPVESTHVTPDGQVLCILEGTGLRDEDEGFGSLERAVRGMKGVEDVEAHGMPFAFSPDAPFEVLDAAVGEAIERTKPAVPGHDGDQGVFRGRHARVGPHGRHPAEGPA